MRALRKEGMLPTLVRSPLRRRTSACGVGRWRGKIGAEVGVKSWVSEMMRKVVGTVAVDMVG